MHGLLIALLALFSCSHCIASDGNRDYFTSSPHSTCSYTEELLIEKKDTAHQAGTARPPAKTPTQSPTTPLLHLIAMSGGRLNAYFGEEPRQEEQELNELIEESAATISPQPAEYPHTITTQLEPTAASAAAAAPTPTQPTRDESDDTSEEAEEDFTPENSMPPATKAIIKNPLCHEICIATRNTHCYHLTKKDVNAPLKNHKHRGMTWLTVLIELYYYHNQSNAHNTCTCNTLIKHAIKKMLKKGASLTIPSHTNLERNKLCTPQELIEKYVPELREFLHSPAPTTNAPKRVKVMTPEHAVVATHTEVIPQASVCGHIQIIAENTHHFAANTNTIDAPVEMGDKNISWLVMLIESYHHVSNHSGCTCKELLKNAIKIMLTNGASLTKPSATNFSNTLCTPQELIEKHVPELCEFIIPTHTTTSTTASCASSAAAATSECPLLHDITQHDSTLMEALDHWYTAKKHPAECACKQRLRAIIQEKLAAGASRIQLCESKTIKGLVTASYLVKCISDPVLTNIFQ